jgi:hypothetical protein
MASVGPAVTSKKERIMMRITTVVSAAGLVLMGAVTLAQNVVYDFDSATNFSRFGTYAWVRGTVLTDELNHNRVVNAVNAQLARKGLAQVERSAHPDLFVAYHASFDRDLQLTGFSSGWGPYRLGVNRLGVVRTEEILTGTLAVDIVDTRTNTIVWRGMASKEIDVRADPRRRERNINQAAERLFKNYPPAR